MQPYHLPPSAWWTSKQFRRLHHHRLVVRHDRSLTVYGGFFHIACFMIVLRRVLQ